MKLANEFFAYAREREATRRRRAAGVEWPWTQDPILQQYSFCNVHREQDRTTRWIRENVRQPLAELPEQVTRAIFIARWFNRIETLEILNAHELLTSWNTEWARQALHGVKPIVTGAYMLKTPTGMDKFTGIAACIEQTLERGVCDRVAALAFSMTTLEEAHSVFMDAPFLGSFMAYELVTDLRHTAVLDSATDIMSWASAGPGAARGLDRVHGDRLGTRKYGSKKQNDLMCAEMRELLALSSHEDFWPQEWDSWEMREVEHTLCEFDKYERCRLSGESLKRRFEPAEKVAARREAVVSKKRLGRLKTLESKT